MDDSVINRIRVTLPKDSEKFTKVCNVVDKLKLSEEQMNSIMSVMEAEMRLGLSKHEHDRKASSLQMENTFVHDTMDGTEHGEYIALDLGGTNFRVIYIEMRNGRRTKDLMHHYEIPDNILNGTGTELFDYIAGCIAALLLKKDISTAPSQPLPLGFTFSFPMVQRSLTSALLLTWTKKFKCSGTVMKDVVLMLEEAIARQGDINVRVVAILNDTVGTLMTGAYEDPTNCAIGLILGTGSNASYIEHLDRVEKWVGGDNTQEVIDTEWGAFGDNGVLDFFKTPYDFEIDRLSNHKGSFTFEKLFAGLYLGELVRLIMLDLTEQRLLFGGVTDRSTLGWVSKPGAFRTGYVSTIEGESGCSQTQEVLRSLGIENMSDDDILIVQYICALVSNRAAKIVVSALTVLLRHIKREKVTVAVDGSLFSYHPTLRPQIEQLIAHTIPQTQTTFIEVKDGSGMGAAYVAAVVHRMERQK